MNEWKFSQKQLNSIANASADYNIWDGSVRSGKTVGSLYRWIDFLLEAPEADMLMVGRTQRTLERNILTPLKGIVKPRNFSINRSLGEVTVFGRPIHIVGASNEQAFEKIQGPTYIGAYGDELTLWPKSFHDMLQTRLSLPGAQFFGTTNPASPNHYLKKDFIDMQNGDFVRRFHFTLQDNHALPARYVEKLKAFYVPGSPFYRRYIDGEWVLAEGVIYFMFNEDSNVRPTPIGQPYSSIVSTDYGTANPTAALLLCEYDDGIYLMRSYYYQDKDNPRTDDEHADGIEDMLAGHSVDGIVVDPSALSFKTVLRQRGFKVIDADNDVVNGIRNQAAFLQQGRYFICDHPSNEPVVNEYSSYVWDEKAQARGEDKPVKANDHGKDAERYGLMYFAHKPASANATLAAMRGAL